MEQIEGTAEYKARQKELEEIRQKEKQVVKKKEELSKIEEYYNEQNKIIEDENKAY